MTHSPYKMGWILAMFDLPVMTDDERRAATRFRNDLLDHGYLMIQFSVYARPCVNYEQMDGHITKVKRFTPLAGNVRLIFLTDEQWKKSYTVIGANYGNPQTQLPLATEVKASKPPESKPASRKHKHEKDSKMPGQVEFWE